METKIQAAEAKAKTVETKNTEAEKAIVGDAKHGQAIFQNICIHCHRTDHEASAVAAPGLRDVLDRHSEAWLFQWLKNPSEFAEKDETAKALTESNPYGLVMPAIPEMTDPKNRRDVIEFLKTLREK
ncbi:MAG: cytochrome c [Mariprofundaceae bacterium]